MTHGNQTAETSFQVELDGAGSSANVISRSVARDDSRMSVNACAYEYKNPFTI